jgi:proteasome accessory factor B
MGGRQLLLPPIEFDLCPLCDMAAAEKLPRWIDLLAALLSHHAPVTFTTLAKYVPAYAAGDVTPDSRKRMFERDKRELRALGVPLESVGDDGDEEAAYTLRNTDFYLPYLGVVSERGVQHPDKLTKRGYQSLKTLTFEPDELRVIGEAATRALVLGDEALADNVRSALRKLAFDLPVEPAATETDAFIAPTAAASATTLSELGDALFRRKHIAFQYHSMGSEQPTTRNVAPYGLFFTSGHWYLAAQDLAHNALRNFRVSRVSQLRVNSKRPDTHDYEINPRFSLRTHSASKHAWEIGDVDSYEAVVEFRGVSGATKAAAALGKPDNIQTSFRRFDVRRTDTFARWLLSFGDEIRPVSPPELVSAYQQLTQLTLARYTAHDSALRDSNAAANGGAHHG